MNTTTTHESIAKTMKRFPDWDNDKTEAESIQLWKVTLMPYNIVSKQQL